MKKLPLNQVLCGDCLDYLKELPDNSIDAVITDPPYFLGVTHNGQKGEYSDLTIMKPFFDVLFYQIHRVLSADGKMYMCCDWRTYPFFYAICQQYMPPTNLLVWDKKSGRVNDRYWSYHELIMFYGTLNTKNHNPNVISISGFGNNYNQDGGKLHPTQKPVGLFQKFIEDSTKEGDVVLDCFAGSGTLAIAAIKTGRKYILMELQEKYCKIIQDRIAQYTGEYDVEIENYKKESTIFSEKGDTP